MYRHIARRQASYQARNLENYNQAKMSAPARTQLNVRISERLERAIDEKRIELREALGAIPSRSDVLRLALEAYLGIDLTEDEQDRRSTTGPAKRVKAKADQTQS